MNKWEVIDLKGLTNQVVTLKGEGKFEVHNRVNYRIKVLFAVSSPCTGSSS